MIPNNELSDRYQRMFSLVARWECEFAKGHYGDYNFVIVENDPSDPGGRTKYGVDQRTFPDIDIGSLTYQDAEQIYCAKCWIPCHCEEMSLGVGEVVFDIAVNCGSHEAIILLQRVVGTKVDGWIGPKTLAASLALDDHTEIQGLYQKRKWYYAYIAMKNGKLKKYVNGWNNRNTAVGIFADKLIGGDIDFDKYA